MLMAIIARQDEIKLLGKLLSSKKAEFLAVFGRRRVGKTYLIRNFFQKKSCVFFDALGAKEGTTEEQIHNFCKRIGDVFLDGVVPHVQNEWTEVFRLLNQLIEKIPSNKKVVIFLDELPWMATKKSKLLGTLDYYWNQYWSKEGRIKLVVCGSSASWIINKIVNNRGGLYNRVTQTIHLKPFNLHETNEYLVANNIRLNQKQVVSLYMVTGGIPFYLSKIEPGQSAVQAIESIAFDSKSILFNEFDALFESLFDDADAYIELVRLIAGHKEGIGQEALYKLLSDKSKGGSTLKRLKDLEDAGFIMRFISHFNKRRGIFYRLSDEYALFYLHWVEPLKYSQMSHAMEKGYWKTKVTTPQWFSWSGYAFEAICYKHLRQIRQALGLLPTAIPNAWRYVPNNTTGNDQRGAQIDLLFDRDDDAITLCEIKFTNRMFEINKDYADNLRQKVEVFRDITGTKKQLFVAMIASNGVKENKYSRELISQVVTMEDLFKV